MKQPKQPFLETLYHLRTLEHLILYNKIADIPEGEQQDVIHFLEGEYEREATGYPYTAPLFDAPAALWGATTLYHAGQLLLYRQDNPAQLDKLLPVYPGNANEGAMLSADLCLRFLPGIIYQLRAIDPNDPVIAVLEQRLGQFHYCGVGFDLDVGSFKLQELFTNPCFRQLYLDRVVAAKSIKWAAIPLIQQGILENLGDHKAQFWPEISYITK